MIFEESLLYVCAPDGCACNMTGNAAAAAAAAAAAQAARPAASP